MAQKTLVLATTNADKLLELRPLFEAAGWPVLALADFPAIPEAPETRDTFMGNALQKVRFVHAEMVQLGVQGLDDLIFVADDGGLCVDALGGAPGVRSKRFTPEKTDEANNAELLRWLEHTADRSAHYTCALAVVHNHYARSIERVCPGRIERTPRGPHGFAYDCLFTPDGSPRTMAEMRLEEKNQVSHRSLAVRALVRLLNARYRRT